MKYLSLFSFMLFLLWIVISADHGAENVFVQFAHSIPCGDKLGHAFIFGCFAFLVNRAWSHATFLLGGLRCLKGSLLVFLIAFIEECTQLFFATRTFDLNDLLFDALGILIVSFFQLRIAKQMSP